MSLFNISIIYATASLIGTDGLLHQKVFIVFHGVIYSIPSTNEDDFKTLVFVFI